MTFNAGRAFLDREGRLLERRLAAALFDKGPVDSVVDALRGYRNPDGGFGHGLEPDKRCPDSLPIDVEGALDVLITAGAVEDWLVTAQHYRADAGDPSYGVTPLDLAPEPDGPWSHLFDRATIEGHLDRLACDQQPDGGWAITWALDAAGAARLRTARP